MINKNLRSFFYKIIAFDNSIADQEEYIWNLLTDSSLYNSGVSVLEVTIPTTGKSVELREVQQVGNVVKGCLALLREDVPTLRQQDGIEKPIPISQGDRLIEKNYFLYYKDSRLLVWQFNLSANHISNFTTMLTALGSNQVALSYEHEIKRLFSIEEDTVIEYVDFKIAAPRKKAHHVEVSNADPTNWSVNVFEMLADTGARQLEIKMQNKKEGGLGQKARNLVRDLTSLSVTRKLQIKVSGATEPIDMLAERFTYRVQMVCKSSSPSSTEIYQALNVAKGMYDADKAGANPN